MELNLNDKRFNFIDIRESISLGSHKKSLQQTRINTEIILEPNSNFSITKKLKSLIYDTKSINLLQSHITTCLNIHNDVLFNHLPPEINIKFLHTNKAHQLLNDIIGKEETAKTSIREIPLIKISTDLVKPFHYQDPDASSDFPLGKQVLINHTRAEFSGQDIYNAGQLITELYFLHELGHIVLDKKLKDSFFISVFRRREFKEDALVQVIKNIEEGFCDVFASYLTQQKNTDLDIIKRYQNVRDESPKSKDHRQYFIEPYDVVNCFNKLKNKAMTNEYLMDDLLHIAVENTKELISARLNDSMDFKKELKIELIKYSDKEIHLNSKEDYLKEIDLLLFYKTMDLDNKVSYKSSLIKNIAEMRSSIYNASNKRSKTI